MSGILFKNDTFFNIDNINKIILPIQMIMFVTSAILVVLYSIDLNGYKTAKYLSTVIAVRVKQAA